MKNCSICKQDKSFSDFNKKTSTKDGFQTACRDCNKERSRKYYSDNREKHIRVVGEKNKRRVAENRDWFKQYKSTLSCVECGENRPPTLDFHHVDPTEKEYRDSDMISNGNCRATIIRELQKCIVLCANCHRMVHHELNSNGPVA